MATSNGSVDSNGVNENWFYEKHNSIPGQCFGLEVEEILYKEKSKFQDILVFQSKTWGRVLVLDGMIQCTEKDEFSYQEMMSFLPLNIHKQPEFVLVIGGGDGGVVREVLKFPSVQRIVLCEIDPEVVEVSRKYLPFMSSYLSDERVTLCLEDGVKYLAKHKDMFDVIITDSSDPVGPAKALFEKPYYQLLKEALRPNGIISCQGECPWIDSKVINSIRRHASELFPVVDYALISTPSYTTGLIGCLIASTDHECKPREPIREFSESEMDTMKLRYYSPDVHRSAFTLPRFINKPA